MLYSYWLIKILEYAGAFLEIAKRWMHILAQTRRRGWNNGRIIHEGVMIMCVCHKHWGKYVPCFLLWGRVVYIWTFNQRRAGYDGCILCWTHQLTCLSLYTSNLHCWKSCTPGVTGWYTPVSFIDALTIRATWHPSDTCTIIINIKAYYEAV